MRTIIRGWPAVRSPAPLCLAISGSWSFQRGAAPRPARHMEARRGHRCTKVCRVCHTDMPTRPLGRVSRPPGRVPRLPGRVSRPPGRVPRLPGRVPRPPGRVPRPPGRVPRPPGRVPRPPGRAPTAGKGAPTAGNGAPGSVGLGSRLSPKADRPDRFTRQACSQTAPRVLVPPT
eukprot:gene10788-biopygen19830